jgi:outer membrane protein OmpA-like peptidoglycan-associated protein
MIAGRPIPRARWLAFCGLALLGWQFTALARDAPAESSPAVGSTGAWVGNRTVEVPPNTERAAPAAPPSDVVTVSRAIPELPGLPLAPHSTRAVQVLDLAGAAMFAPGSDELTQLAVAKLDALVESVRGDHTRRILVTVHAGASHLLGEADQRFPTDQRLSEARAARLVQYLRAALGLPAETFLIETSGASQSQASDHAEAGRATDSRAEITVWFDKPAATTLAGPPTGTLLPRPAASTETSKCLDDGAKALAPVRITVDGAPLDPGEGSNEADHQRCVDVALARTGLQVRYDPLEQTPFLNAIAIPQLGVAGKPVRFTTYTNYARFIERAEMRLFGPDQSVQQTPIAVIPVTADGTATWAPPPLHDPPLRLTTATERPRYVTYVLRVYDRAGRFDETRPRRLDLGDAPPPANVDPVKLARDTERLAYGENTLVLRNIPVRGGAVTVSGSNIPPAHQVFVQGLAVPVDDGSHFVARQILPGGPQQVTVKILNARGEGLVFTRNLTVAIDDSFLVGIADLTAGSRSVTGPIELVTGEPRLGRGNYVDGELAFYYKGVVKGQWLLTAAADTHAQPVRDLFSSGSSKDPQSLLRRIDPNRYYPVYGDDSTTVEDAPTSGKFYVRLDQGDSSVLWGNFQTQLTGTEFIQYARTLYGLDLRYRSPEATTLGEKKRTADAFWAESGTMASRQDFRGTGGSVYYLRNQDISIGSERVWMQVRDKDSGLVVSVTPLVPAQDYDINYLQGRILLHQPLPATAGSATVVHSAGLDGDPVYLVVTYEYVADFSNPKSLALGGHASAWFGDHLQLGLSSFHQGDAGEQQDLRGVDGTLRYKPGTYLKSEYAHSAGSGSQSLTSITGGLLFDPLSGGGGGPANAWRTEAAVDLSELTDSLKGRARAYSQLRDAGFSGPGQWTAGTAVRQAGGSLTLPVTSTTQIAGKFDTTDSATQTLRSAELGVDQKVGDNWHVALGGRADDRENAVPNASPILSQNGARTDVALTVGYHPTPAAGAAGGSTRTAALGPRPGWDAYAFVQETMHRTDTRPTNDRAGVGGGYQLTDALRIGAEASNGSLGFGAKASTDYRIDDHSNVYLRYTLAADQPDALNVGRGGTLTSGARYRYSDATSVYGEDRLQTGNGRDSLTQAYGVDFSPSKRWTYGLKFEHGTISDVRAGDLALSAVAGTLEYSQGPTKYSGALEWRRNDSSVTGASRTALTRNSLSYQVDPDWRVFGKFNWSQTDGEATTALNAEFHETVVGAAWRPVRNDRWNALFKFTILDDQPSVAQVSSAGNTVFYAQHSRVLDVDGTYQAISWLSLGAKYAIRTGELKPTNVVADWYSSQAQLWIARADLLFARKWDGMLEWRRLTVRETDDRRSGVLLGCYRHVSNNFKVGFGYNFTNYSDNLTDLSYRSRGVFMNAIGKF